MTARDPDHAGAGALPEASPPAARVDWRRPALVAGLIGAAMATFALTPLRAVLVDREAAAAALSGWRDGLGSAAGPAFAALTAAAVALGAPRLAFCALGGVLFGFWPGLIWSQIGSVIGAYGCFLLIRWGGRDAAVGRWPRAAQLSRRVSRHGALAVIAARQLPLTGGLVNALLALSDVRHRAFIAGTIVGNLPEAVPMVYIGASAPEMQTHGWGALVTAFSLIAVIWLAGTIIGRRLGRIAESHAPALGNDLPSDLSSGTPPSD